MLLPPGRRLQSSCSIGTGYWSPLCHVRVFVCSRCEDFALSMTSPCSTGTCLPSLDSPLHGLLVFFCSIGLTHVSDPAQKTRVNLFEPFPHNISQLSTLLLFLSSVSLLHCATLKTIGKSSLYLGSMVGPPSCSRFVCRKARVSQCPTDFGCVA